MISLAKLTKKENLTTTIGVLFVVCFIALVAWLVNYCIDRDNYIDSAKADMMEIYSEYSQPEQHQDKLNNPYYAGSAYGLVRKGNLYKVAVIDFVSKESIYRFSPESPEYEDGYQLHNYNLSSQFTFDQISQVRSSFEDGVKILLLKRYFLAEFKKLPEVNQKDKEIFLHQIDRKLTDSNFRFGWRTESRLMRRFYEKFM